MILTSDNVEKQAIKIFDIIHFGTVLRGWYRNIRALKKGSHFVHIWTQWLLCCVEMSDK